MLNSWFCQRTSQYEHRMKIVIVFVRPKMENVLICGHELGSGSVSPKLQEKFSKVTSKRNPNLFQRQLGVVRD